MFNLKKILPLVAIIFFLAGCSQNIMPTNPTGDAVKKIGVYVDEEPLNPNNLREIKIAVVDVSNSGELSVEVKQKDNASITKLQKAIKEINKRPVLKLTGENEIVINGKKVLAMQAWDVKKGEANYAYAVADALAMEFGLKARVEK
jgi:hypothetical protein